jgi:two-component system, chemotaxis family, protein-glutamate methylesterase/glutaminase
MPKKAIRVFVVDDSIELLVAVCSLLETEREVEVVGTARHALEILEQARDLRPDLIITNLHLPLLNGLECVLRLRELLPAMRFVLFADSTSPLTPAAMRASGADGFIDRRHLAEGLAREMQRLFPTAC